MGCSEYASNHLHIAVAASLNNISKERIGAKDVAKAIKAAYDDFSRGSFAVLFVFVGFYGRMFWIL